MRGVITTMIMILTLAGLTTPSCQTSDYKVLAGELNLESLNSSMRIYPAKIEVSGKRESTTIPIKIYNDTQDNKLYRIVRRTADKITDNYKELQGIDNYNIYISISSVTISPGSTAVITLTINKIDKTIKLKEGREFWISIIEDTQQFLKLEVITRVLISPG